MIFHQKPAAQISEESNILMDTKRIIAADQVKVTLNNGELLRLLMTRSFFTIDPAPELAPSIPVPTTLREEFGVLNSLLIDPWRRHWQASLDDLTTPLQSAPIQKPTPWPSSFPKPDDKHLSSWGQTLSRPPRGTPLSEQPSRRYYVAHQDSAGKLPGRLVVLPFQGFFSYRYNEQIGLVSHSQYLEPTDSTYGFYVA